MAFNSHKSQLLNAYKMFIVLFSLYCSVFGVFPALKPILQYFVKCNALLIP